MTSQIAPRRRGPYAKSALTKQRIVTAAFEVFAERGYRGGSLQDVADRAGMSQTSLLHHFPTKGHLLVAVLEHRDASAASEPPAVREPDFPARIVKRARLNEHVATLIELYVVMCGEAMTDNDIARDFYRQRFGHLRRRYADYLRTLAGAGRLKEGVDAERAAASIIALWDGIQAQWLLDRSLDMAAVLADYLNLIIIPEVVPGPSEPPARRVDIAEPMGEQPVGEETT